MVSKRVTHSSCAIVGVALAFSYALYLSSNSRCQLRGAAAVEVADDAQEDALRGLWMRYEDRGEGDPLRFWYFHGDGKGLYRYGKVGLANTHSFDYELRPAVESAGLQQLQLALRFRKSGEQHVLAVSVERDGQGRSWMTIHGDPYEPGARYRKVESELDFAQLAEGVGAEDGEDEAAGAALGDRIWIDYRRHATGGNEFHMYQLAETAIDGRGVGWFHRGDFDNWSTESLTYRIDGERLELFFDIREEPNVTTFRVVEGEEGRSLVLDNDPRDYWGRHRYRDGGRSFSAAFDLVAGLERALADEARD